VNLTIDRDVALARVEGDVELLQDLAQIFLEELPQLTDRLRTGLACDDSKAVQHAAHALKGSAGNFAATAVFELAKQLEAMGRDGDLSQAPTTYEALEAELDRLKNALTDLA
jgi:HPt (histidine-containing phosphotransfer) domain-containing protein